METRIGCWISHTTPTTDLRKRLGLTEGERVVLFFGLLSPSKGLEDLFEAFALVNKEASTRLVVAGYPTKHVNMEKFLERNRELGISERVIFDARYIPLADIRPLIEYASLHGVPLSKRYSKRCTSNSVHVWSSCSCYICRWIIRSS